MGGWEDSDIFDDKRIKFKAYLKSIRPFPPDFVELYYGGDTEFGRILEENE